MTPQVLSSMSMRQKVVLVLFILVAIFVVWQVYGMMKSGGSAPTTGPKPVAQSAQSSGGTTGPEMHQTGPMPTSAPIPRKEPPLSPRESALLQLQQETEAKYISALNELQMLKIEKEIAETNKSIMSAKLDTITAEKNIVNLLKPPIPAPVPPTTYTQGLAQTKQPPAQSEQPQPLSTSTAEVNYTVISVSKLQSRWNAIMGYQGNLYNVHVGDILPSDGSKVISISNTGVVLEKNGMRRKVSMVQII